MSMYDIDEDDYSVKGLDIKAVSRTIAAFILFINEDGAYPFSDDEKLIAAMCDFIRTETKSKNTKH